MKIENLLLATLLFSTAAYAGVGFHHALVGDYGNCTDCNTTALIESDEFPHEALTTEVTEDMSEVESGLGNKIKSVYGLGVIYSGLTIAISAIGALFSSLDIGINLVTILVEQETLQIPEPVKDNIYTALSVMIVLALLAIIIKWRS